MTENEKLRALLAEARQWVGGWAGVLPKGGDEIDSLRQRIDAALAEPVMPCGDCGHQLTEVRPGKHQCDVCDDLRLHKEDRLRLRVENLRLERERDEARAEVERLRGVDCGVTERDGTTTPLCGVCLECAFLRGAEAMREAAIRVCEEPQMGTEAEAIRALPVPEDDR